MLEPVVLNVEDPVLLGFKDWIELECEDPFGEPAADAEFTLTLADGSERKGTLDGDGKAIVRDLPPGPCDIELTFPEEDESGS